MRFTPLMRTIRSRDRLGSVLQQRERLMRRGLDAVAGAAGAAREAMPAMQPRDHRRITVAAVAITATAAGACAYLWWRHRQAQERADVDQVEPELSPPTIAHDGDTEIVIASGDGAIVAAVEAVGQREAEPDGAPAPAKRTEPLAATKSGGTARQGQAPARASRGQRKRSHASDGGIPTIRSFHGPQSRAAPPAVAPAPSLPLPPSSGFATLRR